MILSFLKFHLQGSSARAVLPLLPLLLVSCNQSTSIDLTEKLTVAMLGVFEAPQDADGNAEPRAMAFTLQSVKLNSADGTEIELFEDDPTEYSIINRSQIIAEAEIADYVDQSFSGITVTFAPEVTVAGKIEPELPVTLVNSELLYEDLIEIEKAKSFRLNINVQWKNIVTHDEEAETETAVPPAFSLEIKYD